MLPSSYTPQQIEDFGNQKEAYFRHLIASKQKPLLPMDGLLPLLRSTKKRFLDKPSDTHIEYGCVCVTNACRPNAEFMLQHLEVTHFFDHLVIGDECSHGKPHPEPYLEAMRRIGVKPDECIVFEDSPSGIRSAVAAGIKLIVGIATSQPKEVLLKCGANIVVDDFSELNVEQATGTNKPRNCDVGRTFHGNCTRYLL